MDMIDCLNTKCLCHYFIPTNNLFEYFLSADLSDEVNGLRSVCTLYKDTDKVYEILEYCINEELFYSTRRCFTTMPQLLYNSINLSALFFNTYCAPTDLFWLSKLRNHWNSLCIELETVYRLIS